MLDYALLNALSAVVRCGSFDGAAALLKITPSAVSQRISSLERKLGVMLVKRSKPCAATSTGARLCAHAEQVRALEANLEDALSGAETIALASPVSVSLSLDETLAGSWLVRALSAFCAQQHVLLRFVREDDVTDDCLRAGTVQALLSTADKSRPTCTTERIGTLTHVAVASNRVIERHFSAGVSKRALTRVACLASPRTALLATRWVRTVTRATAEVPMHVMLTGDDVRAACLADMGWALCPAPAVTDDIRAGRLVHLLPGHTLDVGVYWLMPAHAGAQAAALGEVLRCSMAHAAAGRGTPAERIADVC